MAFQTDQHMVASFPADPQHLWGSIPAVSHHNDLLIPTQGCEPPQVGKSSSHRRLRWTDPLDIQRGVHLLACSGSSPTTENVHPLLMGVSASGLVSASRRSSGVAYRAIHIGTPSGHSASTLLTHSACTLHGQKDTVCG